MRNHANLLLWTDSPQPYINEVDRRGLADQVAIQTLPRKEAPSQAQRQAADVLLAAAVPAGLLPTMPNLRWAQSLSAGVEGWMALPDLPAGLVLTCARGTHRESMPENILGALFHITKPYAAIVQDQKQGVWRPRVATPLNGKTLGILGLGAIGQDVARLANALGMRVIGTTRRNRPVDAPAQILPTDQVLAEADFVLLLLPATPQTENFIDASRLRQMRPDAWLLNFGRGHVIRDEDLIAAVEASTIAGAILDVFRQEPLPRDHRFWTTEGIVVLPHIGGPHPQRDEIVARLFAENLESYLGGRPLKEVVDRTAGY